MKDIQLSEHFSLFELTETSKKQFQEKNRILNDVKIQNLRYVAGLLESIRGVLMVPLIVSSGYRCKQVNDAVGSNDRSQHLKAEAVDFIPKEMEVAEAFRIIWKEIKEKKLHVGQLIHETAERDYGTTSWIHVSLGWPWREIQRCDQILRMEGGKYSSIEDHG